LNNQYEQKAIFVLFGAVLPNRRNMLIEPFGAVKLVLTLLFYQAANILIE